MPLSCHCEDRSDAAISIAVPNSPKILHSGRNAGRVAVPYMSTRLFLALFAIGMVGVLATDKPGLFLAGWRHGASYAVFFLALTGTCCWRSTAAFA